MNITKCIRNVHHVPQSVASSMMTWCRCSAARLLHVPSASFASSSVRKPDHCMCFCKANLEKTLSGRQNCIHAPKLFYSSLRNLHSTHNPGMNSTKDRKDGDIQSRNTQAVLSVQEIYEHVLEQNGKDIVVMELSKELNYVDYFVLVTAMSSRHLVHLAETLNQLYKIKKKGSDPFMCLEGKKHSTDWQCIDMGNVVIHFMLEPLRLQYQIEKLWLLGPDHDDLFREREDEEDLLKQFEIEGLRLISAEEAADNTRTDDSEKVKPWDTAYNEPQQYPADFDEDEYVI